MTLTLLLYCGPLHFKISRPIGTLDAFTITLKLLPLEMSVQPAR
jgi:hypothetical protein